MENEKENAIAADPAIDNSIGRLSRAAFNAPSDCISCLMEDEYFSPTRRPPARDVRGEERAWKE
jgi:hypothetical protein